MKTEDFFRKRYEAAAADAMAFVRDVAAGRVLGPEERIFHSVNLPHSRSESLIVSYHPPIGGFSGSISVNDGVDILNLEVVGVPCELEDEIKEMIGKFLEENVKRHESAVIEFRMTLAGALSAGVPPDVLHTEVDAAIVACVMDE